MYIKCIHLLQNMRSYRKKRYRKYITYETILVQLIQNPDFTEFGFWMKSGFRRIRIFSNTNAHAQHVATCNSDASRFDFRDSRVFSGVPGEKPGTGIRQPDTKSVRPADNYDRLLSKTILLPINYCNYFVLRVYMQTHTL